MTAVRSGLAEPLPASLEVSDEFESPAAAAGYCPTELLGTFTLLMAGHGRCVSTAMMLGDREYALWQLARAQGMADAQLQAVAGRLFAWLDEAGARQSR
ncbi:hypothetical protein PE066_08065 [Ramlibacter tataouinensis]|uniref:hypothetical protein n=1 Tax=Ramlibacter tataouinensis TaxID=94132 RepID=UPI0022F3959D|nr:hypothetical protein [Ramlibacter tataouinensis]WBY03476.1 hypothetical protein PE066_08065 [Ramlibacter tataouinensis]